MPVSTAAQSSSQTSKGRQFASGTGRTILVLAGAALIGFGVPALWFWIGGQLGGEDTPGYDMSVQTLVAIVPGMLITYLVVLDICGWIYNRTLSDKDARERAWPVRRASWNRSMRDERYRPGQAKLSAIEVMFVLTASAVSVAFTIWFFLFAESPI
jgi:hypothetical protein